MTALPYIPKKNSDELHKYISFDFHLDKISDWKHDKEQVLLSLLLIYLYRLNNSNNFSFAFKEPDNLLETDFHPEMTFHEAEKHAETLILKKGDAKNKTEEDGNGIYITAAGSRPLPECQTDLFTFLIDEQRASIRVIPGRLLKNCEINTLLLKNFEGHIKTVFNDVISSEGKKPVACLSMLTAEDIRSAEQISSTEQWFPEKPVAEFVTEQCKKTPHSIALKHKNRQITYMELENLSNQWGHYFKEVPGIRPGDVVALHLNKSLDVYVLLLSILKAGGTYLVLDPYYPAERLRFMAEDSQAKYLISAGEGSEIFPSYKGRLLTVENCLEKVCNMSKEQVFFKADSNSLAYLSYTSGSTGMPKASMMSHFALADYLNWHRKNFVFQESAKVLQLTSLSFDYSFQEIFSTWITGGTVAVISEEDKKDYRILFHTLAEEVIQRVFVTPSMLFQICLAYDAQKQKLHALREVVASGEQLVFLPKIRKFFADHPQSTLVNLYGSSEVQAATAKILRAGEADRWETFPSVGKPVYNTAIHILDRHLHPVPVGVPGDICVESRSLAKGYFNRDALNAEKFIPNPFKHRFSSVLYKTGDKGRFLPNMDTEFLGRNDSFVKIQGFRIETGEIEYVISACPNVKDAAVLYTGQDVHKYLTAYAVPEQYAEKDLPQLRVSITEHLKKKLPDFMIPKKILFLTEFPKTPTGKTDRRSLKNAEKRSAPEGKKPDDLKNETETYLADLWIHTLEIGSFNRAESFFDAGGDSLSATILLIEVEKRFSCRIPVHSFYSQPTFDCLCSLISEKKTEMHPMRISEYLTSDISFEKDIFPSCSPSETGELKNIFITGATGFLGVHVLNELCCHTQADFYCLIRGSSGADAKERLFAVAEKYGLTAIQTAKERVIPVPGDLASPQLSLSGTFYKEIARNAQMIYHFGAHVNHCLPYESLRLSNVSGTKEMIKLAYAERPKVLHFFSSLNPKLDSDGLPYGLGGYMMSKWASEQLIRQAAKQGLVSNIYRLNTITGDSRTGCTAYEKDHLMRFIKTCIQLKAAPDWDFVLDFFPVDIISSFIVRSSADSSFCNKTVNILNPHGIEWLNLVSWMNNNGYEIKIIPSGDWLSEIRNADREIALFPFIGLYLNNENAYEEFGGYRRGTFTYEETLAAFKRYEITLPEINGELLSVYFKYLRDAGFL